MQDACESFPVIVKEKKCVPQHDVETSTQKVLLSAPQHDGPTSTPTETSIRWGSGMSTDKAKEYVEIIRNVR